MNKYLKTTLIATLLTTPYMSFADTNPNPTVSPEERAKIESVVHDYLLQKPEVIVEAVQNLQRKQYEQAEQTVKKTQQIASTYATPLFHTNTDPVAGNPNGNVTIVEFFDYQCPHCVDMAPIIAETIKNNPDVRIVFKEFPIRGPISTMAARAALAANKQGKYYDFSHALLSAKQPITQDSIMEAAKAAGLNVDQMKKDMDDKNITEQLKANEKLAKDLKLFGTPAFFVGKTNNANNIEYVPGRMDQAQMKTVIEKVSK